jgi:UDP-N-acetylmuramoyl-tripeptide--D-alanyl-D-alanine ligase
MTTTENIYRLFNKFPKISTDSRKIEKGSIFFALKGANFNGNKFASDSLKKGATYAIVDEKEFVTSEKILLVDNVLGTLTELANLHRRTLEIPILAITGTNGKTTTKELVAAVLEQKFRVSFTEGNLNNHIGVPLTLLKMTAKTQFGVVEMGANHRGEIEALCKIAEPDFGMITNIGKAHLEGFGSFENVIETKSELFNFIKKKNGTFFFNSDNEILQQHFNEYKNKITFGTNNADFTGEPVQSPPFVHIKTNFKKGILFLNSNLIGDYNFENILAAACIGNHFKVDPLQIQKAIKKYQPKNNRSQLIKKGDLRIIMDAYNANPTSMQVSIKSFVENNEGKKYLILGDMLELGGYSIKEHKNILELISSLKIDDAFLVGQEFFETGQQFRFKTFRTVADLKLYLEKNRIKNGNLLIKGSRGIQLEKVLDSLN